jgi:uncharacterized protein YbjQ (UPF0145 family)
MRTSSPPGSATPWPSGEQQAAHIGADAVIGVDIDHETVGSNMLMVSTSGTAVKLD